MFGRQPLELAHERVVPPAGQVPLDSLLETDEPKLFEASDFGLSETIVRELGERWPVPERKRLLQTSLRLQSPEAREVELIRLDAQQVAGRLRLQPLLAEELS